MTKAEAKKILISNRMIGTFALADAIDVAVKALEQEPCEDAARECYEDLCRYFGDAKDILKNREDFKAWLDRIKWHIRKAEELKAENDDLRDQLAMRDRFQNQDNYGCYT